MYIISQDTDLKKKTFRHYCPEIIALTQKLRLDRTNLSFQVFLMFDHLMKKTLKTL